MGLLDLFRRTPAIRQALTDEDTQPWPVNVPVTEDNIREASRTHTVLFREAIGEAITDDDDEDDWNPIGEDRNVVQREQELKEVREITCEQPHCKRALSLYENYIFGPDFDITLKVRENEGTDEDKKTIRKVNDLWKECLKHNRKWWSPDEFGRRTWRDGEQFTRTFETDTAWPVEFRFIDPEDIRGEDDDATKGILTDADDIATVTAYELYDHEENRVVARIPAEEIIHTKIDCDSTEKRGVSRFRSVRKRARQLEAFVRNEVIFRNLQSSIVLIRKVDGSSNAARLLLDNAKTSTTNYPERTLKREKIRPGTIYTQPRGVEVEFAQPKSDFSNAVPLGEMLIQHIAVATGWTYSMLSATGGDSNFAQALVTESPTLQMIMAERKFFRGDLQDIFELVIGTAIEAGLVEGVSTPEELWERFEIDFRYGQIVSRERLKETQADNLLVQAQAMSRHEMSRRAQLDPERMAAEIKEEADSGMYNDGFNNQNPDMAAKQASSQGNASAGGTNQGDDDEPVQHDDSLV